MKFFQERHQFGAGGVIADAERQLLPERRLARQRAVMRLHQRACMLGERRAVGGQFHRTRRALHEPLADHRLESLQLHAHGRLGGAERLGGAGEAVEVGYQQKRLHRRDIERVHFIITYRYD